MKYPSSSAFRPAACLLTLAAALCISSPTHAVEFVGFNDGAVNNTAYNLSTITDNYLILSMSSGTATQAGLITGVGGVNKIGAGTLNVTGSNNFGTAFVVTEGTVGIGSNYAFGAAEIIMNGGGLRAFNAPRSIANTLNLNSQAFSVGRLTTFTGTTIISAPEGVVITADNPDGPANGDSVFSGPIVGAGRQVVIAEGANGMGTGSVVFSGTNTYNGGTAMVGGRLTISQTGKLATYSSLYMQGGQIIFNNAEQTLSRISGSGTLTLGAGHTFTLSATTSNSFHGSITGAGSLSIFSSTTFQLSGVNTFSGTTKLRAGTLVVTNSLALQNSTVEYTNGTLSIFGVNAATFGGLQGDQNLWVNPIANGDNPFVLKIGNNNQSTIYSGGLSGFTNLVKVGTGTLSLTGHNTYSGGTTITEGTLRIQYDGQGTPLVPGTVTLNGGALLLASTGSRTFANNVAVTANSSLISDTGVFQPGHTYTLGTLSVGANTLAVERGAWVTGGTSGITFGATTLTGNANFSVGAGARLTLGAVSGEGFGLTKSGTGSLVLTAANSYTGGTTVNAGLLDIASTGTLASGSALTVNGGTAAFNNSSQTVGSLSGTGGAVALGTGHVFTVASGSATSFGGAITGAGSLVKSGTGTLTLSGSNTYSGLTTITSGRLVVNGSLSGAATVQSGGVLGGSGVIGGDVLVLNGGTFSPGNSPGDITLSDDLAFSAGSTLLMEFSGTAPGMFDQLDVRGTFTAGGTLNLMLISGYTPVQGASFLIFDGPTPGYDFGSFTLATNLGGGLYWDTSALASSGIVTVIPEPSTAALLGLGTLTAAIASRKRRKVG